VPERKLVPHAERCAEYLASWRQEYNCERPHSSLDYRTPEEFRQKAGYADVESKERFPHPHSLDYAAAR
jgi:hypothetical protein